MNPQQTAPISTQTPQPRNVGSIPITRSTSQDATPAGKPGKSEPPAWFAGTMAAALGEDALRRHDLAWQDQFVSPLAEFMTQKGIKHLRVDLTGSGMSYALVPFHESVEIFEIVDATSEEQYFPLGVFFSLNSAVLNAVDHLPQRWDGDHVGQAVSEIRARKIGLYGGSYAVLWRGIWHYDYEAHEWKLVEQQTGTLENPLPITRA